MSSVSLLATPHLFYDALRQVVAVPDFEDASSALEHFRTELTATLPNGDSQAELYLKRFYGKAPVDVARIQQNARSLIAAARTAIVAKAVCIGSLKREALAEEIMATSPSVSDSHQRVPASMPSSWRQADPPVLIEDTAKILRTANWRIAQITSWSLFWLTGSPLKTAVHQITLPIAASRPGSDGRSQEGFLANLCLELLPGPGGELIEHPASALMPFGRQLLDGIVRTLAYREFSIGWRVEIRDHSIPTSEPMDGDSLSGAAAIGGNMLIQKKFPDAGVIYLASARPRGSLLNSDAEFRFDGVGHIASKVDAIVGDDRLDTIIVASEDNRREAEGSLQRLRRKLSLPLEVRVIDIKC